MSLLNSEQEKRRGLYCITVEIGTGTVALEMAVKGAVSQQIPGASWSASTIVQVSLPICILKPVLTGDGKVFVDFVSRLN